jgi:single-strand DNA-binding protein
VDINTISITGNMTTEPMRIGRKDDTGHVVKPVGTRLRVASNTRTKVRDEWVDVANYVNVVVWGKISDIVYDSTRTGSRLAIEGELRYNEWEDAEGNKRDTLEIHANKVVFLDPKPKE